MLVGVSADNVGHIATLTSVGCSLRRRSVIAETAKRNYHLFLFHHRIDFHEEFITVAAEDIDLQTACSHSAGDSIQQVKYCGNKTHGPSPQSWHPVAFGACSSFTNQLLLDCGASCSSSSDNVHANGTGVCHGITPEAGGTLGKVFEAVWRVAWSYGSRL